jgi:hypothetical protein
MKEKLSSFSSLPFNGAKSQEIQDLSNALRVGTGGQLVKVNHTTDQHTYRIYRPSRGQNYTDGIGPLAPRMC